MAKEIAEEIYTSEQFEIYLEDTFKLEEIITRHLTPLIQRAQEAAHPKLIADALELSERSARKELISAQAALSAARTVVEKCKVNIENLMALIEGECPSLFNDGQDINYEYAKETLQSATQFLK